MVFNLNTLNSSRFKSADITPQQNSHDENVSCPDPVLGRIGSLEVRLIQSKAELKAAQRLRYRVFYKEMSAKIKAASLMRGRDVDDYDDICDHLIVVDTSKPKERWGQRGKIVGTYRLLRQNIATANNGFYTEAEFNLEPLFKRHSHRQFLELGRSCVLPDYRTKRTVELLWHGIWAYVLHHKIDVMFGCASLEGTDIKSLDDQLSLLASVSKTPDEWRVLAQQDRYIKLGDESRLQDKRRALDKLPPLIKGYLRLGAYIGEDAVIDYDFGTTDILVVLPIENINPRYISHYGEDAGRYAA